MWVLLLSFWCVCAQAQTTPYLLESPLWHSVGLRASAFRGGGSLEWHKALKSLISFDGVLRASALKSLDPVRIAWRSCLSCRVSSPQGLKTLFQAAALLDYALDDSEKKLVSHAEMTPELSAAITSMHLWCASIASLMKEAHSSSDEHLYESFLKRYSSSSLKPWQRTVGVLGIVAVLGLGLWGGWRFLKRRAMPSSRARAGGGMDVYRNPPPPVGHQDRPPDDEERFAAAAPAWAPPVDALGLPRCAGLPDIIAQHRLAVVAERENTVYVRPAPSLDTKHLLRRIAARLQGRPDDPGDTLYNHFIPRRVEDIAPGFRTEADLIRVIQGFLANKERFAALVKHLFFQAEDCDLQKICKTALSRAPRSLFSATLIEHCAEEIGTLISGKVLSAPPLARYFGSPSTDADVIAVASSCKQHGYGFIDMCRLVGEEEEAQNTASEVFFSTVFSCAAESMGCCVRDVRASLIHALWQSNKARKRMSKLYGLYRDVQEEQQGVASIASADEKRDKGGGTS